MTTPDDLTLLQWFVSGDATLEANQSLRIQPANSLRQLLGRKGLLLATAYDAAAPPRIEVRRDTDYSDLLHQILLDYHYMPIGQGLDSQVLRYAHATIPAGYQMHCTAARQLWKQWWLRLNRKINRSLQMDLLVLAQNQWYPIRDIAINSGTLYVETLRGETIHHGDDTIVWLEKDSTEASEETRIWASTAAKDAPATPTATASEPEDEEAIASPQPIKEPSRGVPLPPCPLTPPSVTPTGQPPDSAHPALASVACTRAGKVYVKTAVGVLVIEGENLKAYSLARRPADTGTR
ncbi:MAG: hypothetical protein WBA99_03675 [Nodosilinea sp.]